MGEPFPTTVQIASSVPTIRLSVGAKFARRQCRVAAAVAGETFADERSGILPALYRHLGGGIKLGAGYNFTHNSADLTDQSYSTRGYFVNLLAAF